MKYGILIAFGFSLLFSCTYRPKEKRLAKFENKDGEILNSFYKKNSDTIEFKRILKDDSELTIQSGQIYFGEYALTHQKFTSYQRISNEAKIIDSLTVLFAGEGFLAKMTDDKDIMFIQIIPDSTMGTLASLGFMTLRQEVEGKIDDRLQSENLGEWFAGDMGAGGNMLFYINDWNNATKAVVKVLEDEGLLGHVLIAKRIMTAKDDWNYEIVYPLGYEGVFNQM